MSLYGVVRHVIYVYDAALDPMFLIGEEVLRDAIDAEDVADLTLFELGRVEAGDLPTDVESGNHLLELRIGLLFQELTLKRVVLKILVLFLH